MLSKPPADHGFKIHPSAQALLSLSRDLAAKKQMVSSFDDREGYTVQI